MRGPVAVIGAAGKSGRAVARALRENGVPVVLVVRDASRLAPDLAGCEVRIADLDGDAEALVAALEGCIAVVNTAHARYVPAILAATGPDVRLVALGSTRRYSAWADAHGDGVRAGEAALLASARSAMILHPTLIYASGGVDGVSQLVGLLRRLKIAPLPGGGRSLVQPIAQSDVTRALLAALKCDLEGPESLVIAGGQAVAYRDFMAAVARHAGLGRVPVVPLPQAALLAAAWVLQRARRGRGFGPAEIRRLTEDKAFDIAPMVTRLGFMPIGLDDGLRAQFEH